MMIVFLQLQCLVTVMVWKTAEMLAPSNDDYNSNEEQFVLQFHHSIISNNNSKT